MTARLEEKVRQYGGNDHSDAAQWCLDSIYSVARLQNGKFCQEFPTAVIVRLRDNLEVITGSNAEDRQFG
ncbi:hypothetical protein F4808DRAFT_412639 [Astrocystis sublimbata]|nr:hypothetical protein F4808DRAFT_412639 [Astrocystis sublimbata]